MSLFTLIEAVRRNPLQYFEAHKSTIADNHKIVTDDDLLALLFSCASFSLDSYFKPLEIEAHNRKSIQASPESLYFLNIAQGLFARSLNQTSEALHSFTRAYDYALELSSQELIARALIYISTIFDMMKHIDVAIDFALRAVRLTANIQSEAVNADAFMNYGLLLSHNGQYHEAITAFHQSEIRYGHLQDRDTYLNFCVLLINLGEAYVNAGIASLGERYIRDAIQIAEANSYFPYLIWSIKFIAEFYIKSNQFEKANEVLILFLDSQLKASNRNANTPTQKNIQLITQLNSLQQLDTLNRMLSNEVKALHAIIKSKKTDNLASGETLHAIGEAIRNGEFHPYLQAKWTCDKQRISGAEILARWIKADGQVISPYHFIDYIENSPQILELSAQLLREALQGLSEKIKSEFPTFVISLNVSPYQLIHQDLVRLLDACCIEFGLSPLNIEIEIIERTFIENNPTAIQQLFALQAKGYGIALDDFGSGYSSLACIVELPIDTVKIDRSLVKDIVTNPKSYQLFRSIVTMLREMNINSVAEGIESEEQLELVQASGCHQGQGFCEHKPQSIEDFLHYLITKQESI